MLHEQLKNSIKEAMLAKDKVRLETMRGVVSACMNTSVANGKKPTDMLTDVEVLEVITRLSKQRKDSIEQFKKGNIVEIHWFGTFYPHFKKERSYKVPKTGEVRTMPSRTTLRFKTSKHMYIYKNKNTK